MTRSMKSLVLTAFFLFPSLPLQNAFPETDLQKREVRARAEGNAAFALDLYGKLLEDPSLREGGGNLFISPHSISTALAMTWAGARGETEKQMARVLRMKSTQEVEHYAFARLRQDLDEANALWVQKGLSMLPKYLDLLKKYYDGDSGELDFRTAVEEARKIINAWVAEKTKGKIEELIERGDLDGSTELVLTNALHFKEDWASRFDPEKTRLRPFKISSKEKVQVPMMYQMSRFGYAETEGLEILRIPFEGKNLSMVFLLPKETEGLEALEKSLSKEKLNAWLKGLEEQEIGILIPRFNMTSRLKLERILAAMGMIDAFSPARADFSGMTGSKGLFIHRVIHQAIIELNEEGAEAAASTAVMAKRGGLFFRADHPFLFLIRNDRNHALLFMGRVANPAS